jgi:hypothetical protein
VYKFRAISGSAWKMHSLTPPKSAKVKLSADGTYQLPQVIRKEQRTLHHDDFGMTQSKLITVINSKSLERNVGGKPVSTFLHTVLENSDRCFQMTNH